MDRLKVGIIGCGAIAQIQHLPHLRELNDTFEIAGLCDLSPRLLATLGEEYGVSPERRFADYHDLVRSDVDAVIVCPFGSHAPPSIAASEAGKHVLVEKPMCTTVAEAQAMVDAADRNGVLLMVAYMKRHDPAYQYAKARVARMPGARFIQVNHLHPDNSLHLNEFKVHRFDDIPASAKEEASTESRRQIAEALGLDEVPPAIRSAFSTVLGSMIHDVGNLHGMFGPPERVVSTDIWADGRGITTNLAYPGERRAICTWVDLPELWDFKETIEVYGLNDRVIVSFPTGFSRGQPTNVVVQGQEPGGHPWTKHLSWHDNAFKCELQHFRECILAKKQPLTPGRDAIADVALVRDIILAYLRSR
ncbi:MAG TPA: Gfo/Idh/MocA family oxidoreductase [Chloroflexota bacterium]|nr:Gfo/Idh/MocA family oxidoreductase [Chloroflexota bacterium]